MFSLNTSFVERFNSSEFSSEVTADLFFFAEKFRINTWGLKDFMKIGKYVHQSGAPGVGAAWQGI